MAEMEMLDNRTFARHNIPGRGLGEWCHARPDVFRISWQEDPYRVRCPNCRVTWRSRTLDEARTAWNQGQQPLSWFLAQARTRLRQVSPLPLP